MFKLILKTDLPQQLAQAQRNLDAGMASLLQDVGVFIAMEQRSSFEDKSRGGGGADGEKWKPLKESTERRKALKGIRKPKARKDGTRKRRAIKGAVPTSQIGVDTGLLRNTANAGFKGPDGAMTINGTTVALEYKRSYAEHFDAIRPLFPSDDNPPKSWIDGIDQIVRDWIDEQLKGIE
ncbi:hypothetical protein Pan44_27090 [Caulifigura coniformis]|uniref:Phage virion morphogenesis family protein n=1 Tax=Caulifigura coniformis TaxID=2527983 RepID=A0A517SEW4_9PLAN|nr:hypothetical protein [Caulifigura coniformis]QDT54674.1 hypothetical protein Pan44_27090 [Caulifigura coniformis]